MESTTTDANRQSAEALESMDSFLSIKIVKFCMKLGTTYPFESNILQLLFSNVLIVAAVIACFVITLNMVAYMALNFSLVDFNEILLYGFLSLWAFIQFYVILTTLMQRKKYRLFSESVDNTYWKRKYESWEMTELKSFNRTCLLYVIPYFAFEGCVFCVPLVIPVIEMMMNNGTERELPFKFCINIPHLNDTPVFEIALTAQAVGCWLIWFIDVGKSSYSIIFSLTFAVQFKLLGMRTKRTLLIMKNLSHTSSDIIKALRETYLQHLKLIQLVDKQNKLNTTIYFLCFMTRAFAISCSIFVFTEISPDSSLLSRIVNALRLVLVFLDAFVNSLATQEIIDQSESIDFTFYEILMDYSLSSGRKCEKHVIQGLSIMHYRSRHPCSINLAFIGNVGIGTFKSIVNSSYSFYSVIRAKAN